MTPRGIWRWWGRVEVECSRANVNPDVPPPIPSGPTPCAPARSAQGEAHYNAGFSGWCGLLVWVILGLGWVWGLRWPGFCKWAKQYLINECWYPPKDREQGH